MTIEFSCSHCDKVLKTSDDKAGRRAKCPQCGEAITVPVSDSVESDAGFDGFDNPDAESPVSEEQSFLADGPVKEEDSFLASGTIDCPMCGTTIKSIAKKCRFCGETLQASEDQNFEPRIINVSDVFSRAWELYKSNLGLCIGASLLSYLLMMVCMITVFAVLFGIGFAGFSVAGKNNEAMLIPMVILLYVVGLVTIYFIQFYFLLGLQSVMLQMTKGLNPGISELFGCSRFVWRMFLCSLVFGILIVLGLVCLIIPGIIVMLMFWPYSYLLIDRDLPGIDSFTEIKKYTKGNLGSLALIFLASFVIYILGSSLTYGIGAIFLLPFLVMVQTVTYAEMTNQ